MAIILKNSWNVPPLRWGSFADIQYAIRSNAEKVYGINSDNYTLNLPLFWGHPVIDYSDARNSVLNYNAKYRNNALFFDGDIDYLKIIHNSSLNIATEFTTTARLRPTVLDHRMIFRKFVAAAEDKQALLLFDGGLLKIRVLFYNIGTYVASTSGLSLNSANNIAVTYDNSNVRIYIKGIEDAIAARSGNIADSTGDLYIGKNTANAAQDFDGSMEILTWYLGVYTAQQVALFNDLPYGLYQKVSRPFYLLPIEAEVAKFYDLNTEISGGSESIQDLITDIQTNAESFFDLETDISATTVQTILDLNTEIAADYNVSFKDLNTNIQAVAESFADLNTEITANSEFIFYDLSSEIAASALSFYDLNTEVITKAQIVLDLNTDIQARGDTFYDLNTDIQVKEYLFYDLNTEISVIRSKYWLDTEIEALSYARWSFNTEWNPNRFLSTEIAAKKPYTFNFKTKTGSSYVASSSEIEILLSGYSWPLRTLFLDYLRVGTSNVYNFEMHWSRGQSSKNPLRNAKIKAEYTNTSYAGGYEVVSCDWLSVKIDGGASQTVNATPLDLGDMPCDSKLDIELTVECRDCSISRGLIFFRLIVTGDNVESLYGAPIVYGDGAQYFEGGQDDYQSPNFICRLYVV